jgi:hypothetical protein
MHRSRSGRCRKFRSQSGGICHPRTEACFPALDLMLPQAHFLRRSRRGTTDTQLLPHGTHRLHSGCIAKQKYTMRSKIHGRETRKTLQQNKEENKFNLRIPTHLHVSSNTRYGVQPIGAPGRSSGAKHVVFAAAPHEIASNTATPTTRCGD